MTRTSRRVALGLSILLLPALLTVPPLLAKDDAGQDLAPAEAPADDYTRSDGSEANQAQVLQQQAGVAARIETARAETANEWLNGGPEGEVLGRIGLTTSTGADTTTAEVEPPARVPLAFNPPAAGTPNPDLTATAAPATPPTGGDQALVPFAGPTEVTGQDTATGPAAWTAQAGAPGIEPTRPAADDTPGAEVQRDLADEDTSGRTPAEQAQWEAEEAQIEAARWSLSIPTKEEMAANRALLVKHGRMAPEQAAALDKVDAGDVLPTDGLLDALLPPEVARELRPPPYVPPTQGPETDEQFLRRLRSNAQLGVGLPTFSPFFDRGQRAADLTRLREMAKHPETLTEEQRVAVEWALGQRPLPFDTGFSEAVDDFVKRNPPGFARPGIAEAWEQFQRQRAGGSGDHVDLPPEYANGAPVLDEVARAKRQWPAVEESALGYFEQTARESTPVLFPVLRRVAAPDRIAREMFRQALARHPRLEQVVEMGRGALQELLRCAGVSSIPRVECMVLAPYRPDEGPRGTSRPLRGGGIEPWEQTSPHTPR